MFIHYFSLLLVCQLIGEVSGLWLRLPIPGPVIGILLLFVGLLVKDGISQGLARIRDRRAVGLAIGVASHGIGTARPAIGRIDRRFRRYGDWPQRPGDCGAGAVAVSVAGIAESRWICRRSPVYVRNRG